MFNFFNFFFPFFIFLEINPLFYYHDYNINAHQFFIFSFLFLIYLNFLQSVKSDVKLDIDILFKYFILLLKTPNFLINYVISILKKIFIYLMCFKYKHIYNALKIFLKRYIFNFFV